MVVFADFTDVLTDSLPEAIGGLVAAAVLAVFGVAVARHRRRRVQGAARRLVNELLAERLSSLFDTAHRVARTDDDAAGLALISAIIDRKAECRIEVIGRGSQWVDQRTREYVSAVAEAILRGVDYTRILILDAELPENGLVWLLLLERFAALPLYRGRVALHPVRVQQSQGLTLQLQIVDETYLHRTNRHYSSKERGVARRANSLFTIGPHADVVECLSVFRQHLLRQGPALSHREIVDLIEELLTTMDPRKYAVNFHWKLALDVIKFLDGLDVSRLPIRGFEFVGSLMPFTFTFEAAQRYCADRRNRDRPPVVVPFERLDKAMHLFEGGTLEHICIPVENTRIDEVTPPTMTSGAVEKLKDHYIQSGSIRLDVSFVLAGASPRERPSQVAAVDSAYLQVYDYMKKRARVLPRIPEPPQSNYHAAWIASQDRSVAAITTQSAAVFFGLQTYEVLKGKERNVTTFSVFSHQRAS